MHGCQHDQQVLASDVIRHMSAMQASVQLARGTHRSWSHVPQAQQKPDKGLGVLEWTGKLVPQGLLVKGAPAAFLDSMA